MSRDLKAFHQVCCSAGCWLLPMQSAVILLPTFGNATLQYHQLRADASTIGTVWWLSQ